MGKIGDHSEWYLSTMAIWFLWKTSEFLGWSKLTLNLLITGMVCFWVYLNIWINILDHLGTLTSFFSTLFQSSSGIFLAEIAGVLLRIVLSSSNLDPSGTGQSRTILKLESAKTPNSFGPKIGACWFVVVYCDDCNHGWIYVGDSSLRHEATNMGRATSYTTYLAGHFKDKKKRLWSCACHVGEITSF